MRRFAAVLALAVTIGTAGVVWGQDYFGGRREPLREPGPNQPYDGRLTFVRVRYKMGFNLRAWEPPWAHDYPTADVHMMKILKELTFARPRLEGSHVMTLTDPELYSYPIAYMSEPGFWRVEPEEAAALRAYLSKGGFIMFDDFRERDWDNLQDQMRVVFPAGDWVELDPAHPVFHSFFELDDPATMTPPYGDLPALFYGMFENNDRNGRLIALANVNNDLGEYWEFSDSGYAPVDLSNEAYKFGVNYFIYGLTH